MFKLCLVALLFLDLTFNSQLFASEKYKIITHTTQNMEEAENAMKNVMERLNNDPEFKRLQNQCTFDINCRPSGKYCIVTIEPIGNTTILNKLFAIVKKIYTDAFMNKYVIPKEPTVSEEIPQSPASATKSAPIQTIEATEEVQQNTLASDNTVPTSNFSTLTPKPVATIADEPLNMKQVVTNSSVELFEHQKLVFIFIALFVFFAFLVLWFRRKNSTILHTSIDNNLLHINQNKSTSLLVDIQAHIIPGLNHDNGPASYDEALNLIIALKDAGYKKIITTPRLSNQIIAQDTKVILHTLDKLRNTLKEKEVDIVIEAAACYELDDLFLRALEQKKVSTFNKNYIFIEGPDHLNYEALKEYIIKIDHAGYKTVLAHPEKYAFIHGDLSNYQELKRLKVLLALDINSLSITNPDDKIKHCSDMLIEHKMIDLIGSHARTAEDVHTIQTIQSSERYKKLLNSNIILNNYLY